MTTEWRSVHEHLMRRLPVRTVACADEAEKVEQELEEWAPHLCADQGEAQEVDAAWSMPSGTTFLQRAEIRERLMLSRMRPGVYYSAKHLAELAGVAEKSFYTHVLRMVRRGQLKRAGRRHHFRYRKA
jgi:hypothetical protein